MRKTSVCGVRGLNGGDETLVCRDCAFDLGEETLILREVEPLTLREVEPLTLRDEALLMLCDIYPPALRWSKLSSLASDACCAAAEIQLTTAAPIPIATGAPACSADPACVITPCAGLCCDGGTDTPCIGSGVARTAGARNSASCVRRVFAIVWRIVATKSNDHPFAVETALSMSRSCASRNGDR